jgi:hypothetical protein
MVTNDRAVRPIKCGSSRCFPATKVILCLNSPPVVLCPLGSVDDSAFQRTVTDTLTHWERFKYSTLGLESCLPLPHHWKVPAGYSTTLTSIMTYATRSKTGSLPNSKPLTMTTHSKPLPQVFSRNTVARRTRYPRIRETQSIRASPPPKPYVTDLMHVIYPQS